MKIEPKHRHFFLVTLITIAALLLFILVQLLSRAWLDDRRVFNLTPLRALSEWPGHLPEDDPDPGYIWQQQEAAGGIVYLYYFPLNDPEFSDNTYCVGTTFVAPENWFSWRSQAGNRLGCWHTPVSTARLSAADIVDGLADVVPSSYNGFGLAAGEFMAYGSVGGNTTPLTIAYGLADQGHQVRIEWADGQISYTPVQNGTFLQTYPANVIPRRFDLLDEQGLTLASQGLSQ